VAAALGRSGAAGCVKVADFIQGGASQPRALAMSSVALAPIGSSPPSATPGARGCSRAGRPASPHPKRRTAQLRSRRHRCAPAACRREGRAAAEVQGRAAVQVQLCHRPPWLAWSGTSTQSTTGCRSVWVDVAAVRQRHDQAQAVAAVGARSARMHSTVLRQDHQRRARHRRR